MIANHKIDIRAPLGSSASQNVQRKQHFFWFEGQFPDNRTRCSQCPLIGGSSWEGADCPAFSAKCPPPWAHKILYSQPPPVQIEHNPAKPRSRIQPPNHWNLACHSPRNHLMYVLYFGFLVCEFFTQILSQIPSTVDQLSCTRNYAYSSYSTLSCMQSESSQKLGGRQPQWSVPLNCSLLLSVVYAAFLSGCGDITVVEVDYWTMSSSTTKELDFTKSRERLQGYRIFVYLVTFQHIFFVALYWASSSHFWITSIDSFSHAWITLIPCHGRFLAIRSRYASACVRRILLKTLTLPLVRSFILRYCKSCLVAVIHYTWWHVISTHLPTPLHNDLTMIHDSS